MLCSRDEAAEDTGGVRLLLPVAVVALALLLLLFGLNGEVEVPSSPVALAFPLRGLSPPPPLIFSELDFMLGWDGVKNWFSASGAWSILTEGLWLLPAASWALTSFSFSFM